MAMIPEDVRERFYFTIVMPLKDGQGPVSDEECDEIVWEVWDQELTTHSFHKYLCDAIQHTEKLNKEYYGTVPRI
jgi:hypothetical protein